MCTKDFPLLSQDALESLSAMIEHCLEQRICMGIDEGFKSFDPYVEHDYVCEIRGFLEVIKQIEDK